MTTSAEFDSQYLNWLDECLEEYNERFHPREFHQGTCPYFYDPGDFVEFSEDGAAYPHGIGGTNFIPNAVTPWSQSDHFVKTFV